MRALVIVPKLRCRIFRKMRAHYRVVNDILRVDECKTYDCGIAARVDANTEVYQGRDISHVGVLMRILQLDYNLGADNPILFQGKWVRNDTASLKYDRDGFLVANFRRWLPSNDDPFIFPSQVEQVFYIPVEEQDVLGWNIVLRKHPRARRIVMEQSNIQTNSLDTSDSETDLDNTPPQYEIVEVEEAQQPMTIAEEERTDTEVGSSESEVIIAVIKSFAVRHAQSSSWLTSSLYLSSSKER
ncbi:hypothetical protein R1sor_017484 [Riccia sorocarpa]|uniref:DUF4216 domain-containing protein n=1 Tax=Riccia sorocarpa TaxID=122646 RepID=A0ABD3IB00_9MARC